MGQRLPLWVREPAEFEPEGDHILCRWADVELVLSPAVAQRVYGRLGTALVALAKQEAQTADIIAFTDHAA